MNFRRSSLRDEFPVSWHLPPEESGGDFLAAVPSGIPGRGELEDNDQSGFYRVPLT